MPLVDGGDVSGANTLSLSIANASAADSGAYDLIVIYGQCPAVRSEPAAGLVVGPTCPGDADGNGVVNFSDITAVLANFGLLCT